MVFINFLLGISAVPRETEHYAYAIFFQGAGGGVTNKVYYGRCANREFAVLLSTLYKVGVGYKNWRLVYQMNVILTSDSSKKYECYAKNLSIIPALGLMRQICRILHYYAQKYAGINHDCCP